MEKEYLYQAEVKWNGEKKGMLVLAGKPDLPVATPPEFGGHEGLTTPEELFVASAVVCFMSTFLAMGAKTRAEWTDFSCWGEGRLEKAGDRGLLFTRIDLYPKVTVGDESRIKTVNRALELSQKYCLVTNSMTTEVVVHPEVLVS
ncbi:MAG: OsmC family protein [Thermodesulfobacteriota bacterium]